jgi:hypothetical protein
LDLYHLWFDLRAGESDTAFADHLGRYLDRLKDEGRIEGYRLTRKKLGLAPPELGEFHVTIEVRDLAQLDTAFVEASRRSGPVEELHANVNQRVTNFRAALYRDFPDPHRVRGSEKF